jgi:hypothetical protein
MNPAVKVTKTALVAVVAVAETDLAMKCPIRPMAVVKKVKAKTRALPAKTIVANKALSPASTALARPIAVL